ncbi:MAG: chemosensory pili system protein ChpA (sensor histidine kinase/response regulator) [Mariniblastus sp.]|jgi:chemosensory pili system protein ChpA (sensor histidine kinase/response regulator)
MTNQATHNLEFQFEPLRIRLEAISQLDSAAAENELQRAALELLKLADQASAGANTELSRGAESLAQVLAIASKDCAQGNLDQLTDLVEFVTGNLPVLAQAQISGDNQEVVHFTQFALEQWFELEGGLGDLNHDQPKTQWDEFSGLETANEQDEPSEDRDEDAPASHSAIEMMLSAVSEAADHSSEPEQSHEPSEPAASSTPQSQLATTPQPQLNRNPKIQPGANATAKAELASDRELLEAFLDDAIRCVGSMEQAAMETEGCPDNHEPIQQFCRELHTLKGASATVGLSQLAAYIHDVETLIETSDAITADFLFETVDQVRTEISSLQRQDATPNTLNPPESNSSTGPQAAQAASNQPKFSQFSANDDASIRIRASQLDRLMDMLAELVVLRNRRENHVVEFNEFNQELARCSARLSVSEPHPGDRSDLRSASQYMDSSCYFSEIAKDIEAVSHGLRDLQKPVSQDNNSITRFIRDFRQELMQLRRVPVSGLFHRLQRAARDAAKSEGKLVHIELFGEDVGLEQETQERLFESLLHVIRNSVSHGIQTPEDRRRAHKPETGKVVLQACSNAQLLIIEVRDDGHGIDHAAVQKRAIEKGLISPHQRPSNEELANFIFHPGFSTREEASQISGRGVGMEIVSKTIEQLHGRIEVESVAGQGTTVRLLIPLRTGIEHVMVFRCNGQLFALPMQSITAVKNSHANLGPINKISLSAALSRKQSHANQEVLVLRAANDLRRQHDNDPLNVIQPQIGLGVDELVGPEEVVVRRLPNLLKNHPLFSGVTLSGSGEKVLILDTERIIEFCHEYQLETTERMDVQAASDPSNNSLTALVVDDSLTARKVLTKFLHQNNFVTVEAGDGIEAIEELNRRKFDLVFTDLDMPNLGGLELLADIQSGNYCDAPVVVVSSRDEEIYQAQTSELGAVDYVKKPFSETSITRLLESLQLLPEFSNGI